jgi:hypothetical protein
MVSIIGSLRLSPGDMILRYFPKVVITATVPCETVLNDPNTTIKPIISKNIKNSDIVKPF